MSEFWQLDGFADRVNFAVHCLETGRTSSRDLDTCFEMYDGDEVLALVLRRANYRPLLASAILRTFDTDTILRVTKQFAGQDERQVAELSRERRARCKAECARLYGA